VEISYVDAILGTTVKVTTLGTNELSQVDLKIPAGGWLTQRRSK
jgi:DnaJ-class molecular chaperone